MKIHDLPLHLRPREKLIVRGVTGLSEAELLAILLRTGYQGKSALEVAKSLLKQHSLTELAQVPTSELAKVKGIGPSRATTVLAALTLGRLVSQPQSTSSVTNPEFVFQLCHELLTQKQEHLVCLYLNARNHLINQRTISIGTINSSLLHPREVFAPALELRATSLILVHNHPTGDSTPSEEDLAATDKIIASGEILDINVLDHVIIGAEGWTSLRQGGFM